MPQLLHAALLVLCLPAGQDLQNAWLVASWNLPAGQATHDAASEATRASKVPVSHAMHDDWPGSGWCWPAAQPTQSPTAVEPFVDTYLPLGQSEQSFELDLPVALRYWPASQGMHACFASGEYLPLSHSVQLLPPAFDSVSVIEPGLQALHSWVGSAEYVPDGQATHFELTGLFGTVPLAQTSHLLAWLLLTDPSSQSSHSVVEPGEYRPFVQPLHAMPASDATLSVASLTTEPALHSEHALELGPLYWPASQSSHAVMLSRPWYCPATQILQNACVWASWYLPAGHDVQLWGALALGWNMPIAHGWQSWPAW
jgi:hypothetical protein